MSLYLHVERLVLEGLPIGAHEVLLVQAALESELARLLREQSPNPQELRGAAVPTLRTGSIHLADGVTPARIGDQVAKRVHDGIAGTRGPIPKVKKPSSFVAGGVE